MATPRKRNQEKAQFAVVIDEMLTALGRRQKWLASRIGANFNTFRTHINRNEFYQSEAEAICAELHLPVDPSDVIKAYEFRVLTGTPPWSAEKSETLLDLFQRMNRHSRSIQQATIPIRETFLRALGRLGCRDLSLVFSGTVTPLEMDLTRQGGDAREQIARSVNDGGTFIYFRPHGDTIKKFTNDYDLRTVIPFAEQVNEFDGFQEDLVELLERDMSQEQAASLVARRTIQLYPYNSPFFTPGVSFGLLKTFDEDDQTMSQVSVRLPGDIAFLSWDNEFTAARMVSTAEVHLKKLINETEGARAELKQHALNCLRDYWQQKGGT